AERRRELHIWLGPPPANDLYSTLIQERLHGTCEWILERPAFLDWISPDVTAGTAKFLWINGAAGFGKTTLCARIVQHLTLTRQAPVAHFFLSSEFESREDPFLAVRSWVHQLASQHNVAYDLITKTWMGQDEQLATRATVIKMLRDLAQAIPYCILVLDGLDECIQRDQRRLLRSRTFPKNIPKT
ncbi:hypothetical protein F5883DRAFT_660581, partial [Diaporthe sp. PMI_573]